MAKTEILDDRSLINVIGIKDRFFDFKSPRSGTSLLLTALGVIIISLGLAYISVFGVNTSGAVLLSKAFFNRPMTQITVSLNEQTVKIGFDIAPVDMESVMLLSKSLGLGNDWQNGMSFEIDPLSASSLKDILPVKTSVRFLNNRLIFGQGRQSGLIDSEVVQAGTFQIHTNGTEVRILSMNPSAVLTDATSSGRLKLSTAPELFIVASRLAKIELEVNAHQVNGEVILH